VACGGGGGGGGVEERFISAEVLGVPLCLGSVCDSDP